ncbi:MAG: hypothetical protein ACOH5I_06540 [Oligoflexus sp.]
MDNQFLLFNNCITLILVILASYLAAYQRRALLYLVIAATLAIMLRFSLKADISQLDWMEFVKLMFLVPFGLGTVIGFGLLPRKLQQVHISWFTVFINLAVLGNIFMMVFVPADETYRGLMSRVTCLLLLVWLMQEMAKVKWRTIVYDNGFFIFNSSLLAWVLCHACYRLALISLPSFASIHYLLMEPLSLGVMVFFYHMHGRKYPVNYYFGYADTLVVSTMAVVSQLFDFTGRAISIPSKYILTQHELDLIFLPLQSIVLFIALGAIGVNLLHSYREKYVGRTT